ncbi:hypothetical protein EZV62_027075 [Acer yangbiense]|uniref:Fe2OG dioxygenase domain-containing protein n=1 Tax=Acer yangbiense TaxID=1000413 RepID=A0A5C7GSP9_9ROSI|nr:hypothetical protein EZV62_027075 [Acer yangbiense]
METKEILSLDHTTLAVPFVQELVKKPLTSVPPRYVHPDQDPPIISLDSSSPQVPVIDMQRLLSEDFMDSELQKLDQACREWGFFPVSSSLVEKVKLETEKFFKLPMEEKSKYGQLEGDVVHVEGYGNVFVGETMEAYSADLKNIMVEILRQIRKKLRMDETEMTILLEGKQAMGFNYYPPCPQPKQVIGLPAHSDFGGITFLLDVNDVQGLQIKKDGLWIPVKSLPNAFIINIGKLLSIEHRATINSLKERMSIATFCNPKMDGEIAPAPSLVTPETPAMFKRIGVVDYTKGLFKSTNIDGKAHLDCMRIQNEQGKSN